MRDLLWVVPFFSWYLRPDRRERNPRLDIAGFWTRPPNLASECSIHQSQNRTIYVIIGHLIETQVQDLENVEVLEESSVDLWDVVGGQVEDDEAVEAAEDAALDPVFVQAVAGEVEDLEMPDTGVVRAKKFP